VPATLDRVEVRPVIAQKLIEAIRDIERDDARSASTADDICLDVGGAVIEIDEVQFDSQSGTFFIVARRR